MRFKERRHLHVRDMHGGATSADAEDAASHPEDLAQMINKHTVHCRLRSPFETRSIYDFITREKSVPGFGGQADSLVRG